MKKFLPVFLFTFVICISNLAAQNEKPFIGGGGVVNGKAISLVKPEYPAAAKAVGAEGAVNVQVLIDEEGNVSTAKAISGHALLKKASEEAALASKFAPTTLSGTPVKVTGVVVYNFVAEKETNKTEYKTENFKGNILNGKALSLPKPEYPNAAKAVKAEGFVKVEVTINEKGNVISAVAVSGHKLLQKSAMLAASKAKFAPVKLKGKFVQVKGFLLYNFAVN